MPDLDYLPESERPLWRRLSSVCGPLGLSADVVLAAIDAKQLPIRAQQFGRTWHVHYPDLIAYLQTVRDGATEAAAPARAHHRAENVA